jgi:hypothetical protein
MPGPLAQLLVQLVFQRTQLEGHRIRVPRLEPDVGDPLRARRSLARSAILRNRLFIRNEQHPCGFDDLMTRVGSRSAQLC